MLLAQIGIRCAKFRRAVRKYYVLITTQVGNGMVSVSVFFIHYYAVGETDYFWLV